jgi:hypothetical protein
VSTPVERLFTEAVVWLTDDVEADDQELGATVEQMGLARDILRMGGVCALSTSERIMARAMTHDDWAVLYDAFSDCLSRIGLQLVTVQSSPEIEKGDGPDATSTA